MDFTSNKDYNSDSLLKLESVKAMDVCRTCLRRGLKMNNIFDITIVNICERIQFCTGLKFVMGDPLPSNICNVCLDNLNVSYNFKLKCQEADRKLWAYYSKPDSVDIDKVYIRVKEDNYHNPDDIKEKELIICNDKVKCDGIMDGNEVGDLELSNNEEEDISLRSVADKKVLTNENQYKDVITCSPLRENESAQCPYKKSVRHMKNVKRTKFRRLFCESCNIRFDSKHDSDDHKKTVHKDDTWVCQHCGKVSTKKSAYYYHMNSHYKNDMAGLDSGKRDGNPSARGRKRFGVKRGPYKKRSGNDGANCEGSPNESGVKRPRRKFKLNRNFCEKCDVRFQNDQEFIAHKRDVHKHVYLCEICGRVFYNRDARFSHMTSHEQPKFACDHCDYDTTRKQDLIKHLYIHNGVKGYQCEYCPLSFYTASNLQHHRRRHRDGPHVCAVCDKRILDRYSFKRHMDTHNGTVASVRFACQLCGSCFRRSSRLNQHMLKRHNVHTPPQRPGRRRIEPREVL